MDREEAKRLHEINCSGCSEYGGHKRFVHIDWCASRGDYMDPDCTCPGECGFCGWDETVSEPHAEDCGR